MKKTPYILLMMFLAFGFQSVLAQKKPTAPKRKLRTIIPKIPVPKIEAENWQPFEAGEDNLRILFPKEPTTSKTNYTEFGRYNVDSTVIQAYINTDYYMVEVRKYPAGTLADRTDLAESYGEWLKTFILARVKIINEKSVGFNQYKMVEFVYQQSGSEVLVHRAMVAGDHLYQLIVQYEIKKGETLEQSIEKNRPKIDKFFLSFELTGEEFTS